MFEFKATIPGKTESDDEQIVTLVFKDYGNVPGRVSRHNIGHIEAQIWASLEWGLVEPAHWPVDSERPGTQVLDEVPQRQITEMYQAWQKAAGLD